MERYTFNSRLISHFTELYRQTESRQILPARGIIVQRNEQYFLIVYVVNRRTQTKVHENERLTNYVIKRITFYFNL